jgi:hypothetical protein
MLLVKFAALVYMLGTCVYGHKGLMIVYMTTYAYGLHQQPSAGLNAINITCTYMIIACAHEETQGTCIM